MSKKKVQHKGKPKHALTQNEDVVFRKSYPDEEYITVVDFETSRKYGKRLIQNNWSKYESNPDDFQSEYDERETPNDFAHLLKTASSDCFHFEFNSEKLWKTEDNSIPPSKVFNLNLDKLSKGLACVPFYERMGLDEMELTAEDKERFDREAENSWKEYDLGKRKLTEKCTDMRTANEAVEVPNVGVEKVGEEKANVIVKSETECCADEVGKSRENRFSNENEENMEDWLDSILDN